VELGREEKEEWKSKSKKMNIEVKNQRVDYEGGLVQEMESI